jgi:hypothetical protein
VRRSTPLYALGGVGITAGVVFAMPMMLGLGAASACACAQRTADQVAEWTSCAKSRVEVRRATQLLPTTRLVEERDASGNIVGAGWTKPVPTKQFEAFLNDEITPHCGAFSDARAADLKTAQWRKLYGYEELNIPDDPASALARNKY